MKSPWFILVLVLLVLVVALVVWLAVMPPAREEPGPAAAPPAPAPAASEIHIGLVPERNIFELRTRYLALARYLSAKLDRPVAVVTVNTYQAVLQEFAEKKVDAAFLGSLVAVLAIDRLDAQVLVKPVDAQGRSTYHGVIIVKENSPIRGPEDLAGRTVAMIRTTTAGDLFPIGLMSKAGVLAHDPPARPVWVGTYDDVILETLAGRTDAGAVKNLRLDAYLAAHPEARLRRLAESAEVPNDALIVRAELASTLGPVLKAALLGMDKDPAGAKALGEFGAVRFVDCRPGEFQAVYDGVQEVGGQWERLGIDGPPPKPYAPPRGS
jgi:phosphonate transport system substrate-binding protein